MNLKISVFVLLIFLVSCNSNKDEDIRTMFENPIALNIDAMNCIRPKMVRDSILYNISDPLKEKKIIVYFDSKECASCAISKLHSWNGFLKNAAIKYNMACFFIFCPAENEVSSLETLLRYRNLYFPVYIDTEGLFSELNPHIPQTRMLHTFLIDNSGNIIFVGDPRRNKKLQELFIRAMNSDKI